MNAFKIFDLFNNILYNGLCQLQRVQIKNISTVDKIISKTINFQSARLSYTMETILPIIIAERKITAHQFPLELSAANHASMPGNK